MDKSQVITSIIALVLGGGIASSALNLVRARNESQKAPVERDSVIVTSAESAVAVMQKVLDVTNQQLARKEQELADVTATLTRVKTELKELRERCSELEELLNVITTEQEKAHHKGPLG